MNDNTMVSLHQIVKYYKKGSRQVEVLKGLSLRIPRGSFTAMMGPSGSGKTTLLNLIGGLDIANSGEIQVAGTDLNGMSSSQLAEWRAQNIGFIFQFYNLLPHLTALQNVELPLLLLRYGRKDRKQRALTALELVGLQERAHHVPSELSGGEEQRVAIARALISDPALLLADEPTGDLDRETTDEILELLKMLNQQYDKTIIMVTHDPEAARFASQVVHMDKGQIRQ